MKSSRKLGGKNRFDRISSLPDELIGHILSNLPTRCAVSTSILSTRWRYLYTLTDCLFFDDAPCFVSTSGKKKGCSRKVVQDTPLNERFKEFVYKVFKLHQISPIKKFSLVCHGTCDVSDLDVWVSNAVQKGVQELHYEFNMMHGGLPDGVLVCETLVRLELICYSYYKIKTPLSASLPSLKILHLEKVGFYDMFSIQRLFSSSKVLEELTLNSCVCHSTGHVIISTRLLKVLTIKKYAFYNRYIEIDAPNLAYLIYYSNQCVKIVPSWKYSCSLVRAEINFGWTPYGPGPSSNESEREMFRSAACKTTKLSIPVDSVKLASHEQMPEFQNLSKLHLSSFPYDSWKYVTSVLDKSPQLETLIFEKGLVHCSDRPDSPLSESQLPFSCHAQVIEVHNLCGHEGSLSLLRHLLRNARFLKKLLVHRCPCSCGKKREAEIKINKGLITNLPRASSNCCIEVRGRLRQSTGRN